MALRGDIAATLGRCMHTPHISMGCTASEPEPNPAESALCGLEACLHFEELTVNQHFFALRRYYQTSPFLNNTAFAEAAKSMKIHTTNSPASPKTEEFYASLRSPEIKAKDLVVLAVLLAPGSENEKAEVLFEAYDNSNAKVISKATVEEMVTDLIDMSVTHIQVLADGLSQNKPDVEGYLGTLRNQKQASIEKLMQAIIGEKAQITTAEFLSAFEKLDCQALLSSQKVRRLLYSKLPSKPA